MVTEFKLCAPETGCLFREKIGPYNNMQWFQKENRESVSPQFML